MGRDEQKMQRKAANTDYTEKTPEEERKAWMYVSVRASNGWTGRLERQWLGRKGRDISLGNHPM